MARSLVAPGGDIRPALPELLDVMAVAALLSCSPRHVLRLAGSGRMPPPVKVGRLRRWSRSSIATWIANGGSDPARRHEQIVAWLKAMSSGNLEVKGGAR